MKFFLLSLALFALAGCGVAYKGTGGPSIYSQMQQREFQSYMENEVQREKHEKRLKKFEAMSWEELEKHIERSSTFSLILRGPRNRYYAQYEMGRRYEYGVGVEVNLRKAKMFYGRASYDNRSVRRGDFLIKTGTFLSVDALRAIFRVEKKLEQAFEDRNLKQAD